MIVNKDISLKFLAEVAEHDPAVLDSIVSLDAASKANIDAEFGKADGVLQGSRQRC